MSAIIVQTTTWPVMVLVLPPVVEPEDIKPFVDELRAFLTKRPFTERFACISDLTMVDGRRSEASTRAMLGTALHELTLEIRARGGPHMVVEARVTPSAVVRGISMAIEWINRSEWPVRFFSTMEDATQWAQEVLKGFE